MRDECKIDLENIQRFRSGTKTLPGGQFKDSEAKVAALDKQKRTLDKKSGCTSKTLERPFLINENGIAYYKNAGAAKEKKTYTLEKAVAKFQEKRQKQQQEWGRQKTDNYRLEVTIPQRKNKPVFMYTNDSFEARLLEFRINCAVKPNIKTLFFKGLAIADTNYYTQFFQATRDLLFERMQRRTQLLELSKNGEFVSKLADAKVEDFARALIASLKVSFLSRSLRRSSTTSARRSCRR